MKNPHIIELPDGSSRIVGTIVAAGAAVALVILAVAVWQISGALSIGCIFVSAGAAFKLACEGVGYMLWRKRQGDAELALALGKSRAMMLAEREGRRLFIIDQERRDDG